MTRACGSMRAGRWDGPTVAPATGSRGETPRDPTRAASASSVGVGRAIPTVDSALMTPMMVMLVLAVKLADGVGELRRDQAAHRQLDRRRRPGQQKHQSC